MSKSFRAFAEGTYGCVGTPSLSCVDNSKLNKLASTQNVVGKLMSRDEEAKEEFGQGNFVRKLDPTSKFSLTSFGICHAKFTGNENNVGKSCPERKPDLLKAMRKHGSVTQLISPNGGYDLENTKAPLKDILPAMGDILKGLIVLKRHGLVHTDIKAPNIVYSKELGAKLIDFGIPTNNSKHDIYNIWYDNGSLEFSYATYPPEWDWLARMVSGNAKHYKKTNEDEHGKDNTAKSLVVAVAGLCKRPQYHSLSALAALDKGMMAVAAPDPRLPIEVAFKKVMLKLSRTDIWSKVDLYGVGITIGEVILSRMPRHGLTNEQFYKVTEWIAKATDFNVFTRLTPEQAYAEWVEIWSETPAGRPQTRAATRRMQTIRSRSRSRSLVRKCVKIDSLIGTRGLPPYVAGDCKGIVRSGQLSKRRTRYTSTPDKRKKYYWKTQ